jgi:tetratricopeptide (TPR) repeat protein
MASEDEGTPSEPEHEDFLEEIRKRAEEAELKRIEEDEQDVRPENAEPATESTLPDHTPFPLPVPESAPRLSQAVKEQKIAVLRERLAVALDRGKVEKAAELLAELRRLVPDDASLADHEKRIQTVRELRERARESHGSAPAAEVRRSSQRAPEPASPPQPVPKPVSQPTARQKSIPELIELAHSLYQQEKYDQSLVVVDEILSREEGNEEALRLREQVVKAQEITEMVRREEARRKAEEAERFPDAPKKEPVLPLHEDRDVWGTTTKQPAHEGGYELAPEEAGPVAPPKPALFGRIIQRTRRIRIPWKPIVGVLIVAAAGISGYVIVDYIKNAVSPPSETLLVLPPVASSADTSMALLADGFAEDLIGDFSVVEEIRVIGPVSTMSLKGSALSYVNMARSLKANYYLQWNISRVEDWFVIQANLFDTLSMKARWVARLQSSLRELPATRLDMARKILGAIEIVPEGEGSLLLRRAYTTTPAVFDMYYRGRKALRERSAHSPQNAIEAFSQAVVKDSLFPAAQSGLGWSYVMAYESQSEPPAGYISQALACVQRAVELGWRSSETFRVWGMVEVFRGQPDKALERFEDAVRVGPSDAEALRRLAVASIANRRFDAAIRAADDGATMDPSNSASQITAGMVHQFLGQYVYVAANEGKESRSELNTALQAYERGARLMRDRSEYNTGLYADVLVFTQHHDRAIDIMTDRVARMRDSYADYYKLARIQQSAGSPKQDWEATLKHSKDIIDAWLASNPEDALALSYLALAETRLGAFKEAVAANKQAQALAPKHIDVLYNTARMYTLQRDKTKALETLKRAVDRRYSLTQILDMDFFNLRSEEGFLQVVCK